MVPGHCPEAANSDWPLTSAGSLHWSGGEPNSDWLLTSAGSLGQPGGMLNSDWQRVQAASLCDDEAIAASEAC